MAPTPIFSQSEMTSCEVMPSSLASTDTRTVLLKRWDRPQDR